MVRSLAVHCLRVCRGYRFLMGRLELEGLHHLAAVGALDDHRLVVDVLSLHQNHLPLCAHKSRPQESAKKQRNTDEASSVLTYSVLLLPSPSVSSSIICGHKNTRERLISTRYCYGRNCGLEVESALASS